MCLIIGAGGAGLTFAAIEASGSGATQLELYVNLLLGKAHTVMAEGGMAASMGNVDDRDNWKVHFADTMRGGQYLNNCNMADLACSRSRCIDVCMNLKSWGALI